MILSQVTVITVQVDKQLKGGKMDEKGGFGRTIRSSIRRLSTRNKMKPEQDGDMTILSEPDDENIGVMQRGGSVKRNTSHARKRLRPKVVEFEDAPVLGRLN